MGLLGITIYLNYLINYYQQKEILLLIDKEAKQELIINLLIFGV